MDWRSRDSNEILPYACVLIHELTNFLSYPYNPYSFQPGGFKNNNSLHIVRVQVLAPRAGSSFTLVEGQVKGQFAFSMLWEVGLTLGGDFSGIDYLKSIPSLGGDNLTTTLLCIIWIGMATNAFATWAQISGQQRVGASRAAIFYATQPVWAVVLSVMIGLDTLSTFEVIGGMLIVSGSVLLALADNGMKGEG